MMTRGKIIIGLLLVGMMFWAWGTGIPASAADYRVTPCDDIKFNISYTGNPIKLRLSHHAPETHPIMKNVFIPWIDEVKKVSNGKLIIERYMGGTLHGPRDGFKACATDITDITAGYTIWQPTSFDLEHVIALPFAFDNPMTATIVGTELYPKYLKKEYENMGVYLASYLMTTPHNIISKRPIRTLADLKGKKLSCPAGPQSEMLKLLGAVPVGLPTPEIYPAFQRGLVDGTFQTSADMINWKTWELGKFHLTLNLTVSTLPHCMNRKTFDNLPPDLKKVLYVMLQVLAWENAAHYIWSTDEALSTMKKAGIEMVTIPASAAGKWREPVEPLWAEFIKKNDSKGLPASQCVKDMKDLTQKYIPWTPVQIRKLMVENPIPGIISGM
jgi:TRAP-type transport system periplasmic protein